MRIYCLIIFLISFSASAAPPPYTKSGEWYISELIDPIDDSKANLLILPAMEGESYLGEPVSLYVRCHLNKTVMFINWKTFIDMEPVPISHRIDDRPAETNKWTIGTSYRITFHPSPIALLKEMEKSEKLTVKVIPDREAPIFAIFDTRGAAEALTDIRKNCNW